MDTFRNKNVLFFFLFVTSAGQRKIRAQRQTKPNYCLSYMYTETHEELTHLFQGTNVAHVLHTARIDKVKNVPCGEKDSHFKLGKCNEKNAISVVMGVGQRKKPKSQQKSDIVAWQGEGSNFLLNGQTVQSNCSFTIRQSYITLLIQTICSNVCCPFSLPPAAAFIHAAFSKVLTQLSLS